MKIEKDGNAYCVKADNFVNLQESKDYFFIEEDEYQRFIESHKQELKEIIERIEKENEPGLGCEWYCGGFIKDELEKIKEEYGIEE